MGIPVGVASPLMLEFWFLLIGVNPVKNARARALLKRFGEEKQKGGDAFHEFVDRWTVGMIEQARRHPAVSGIHLMPMESETERVERVLRRVLLTPQDREKEDRDPDRIREQLKKMGVRLTYSSALTGPKQRDALARSLQVIRNTAAQYRGRLPLDFPIYLNWVPYKQHFRSPVEIYRFAERQNGQIRETGAWEL